MILGLAGALLAGVAAGCTTSDAAVDDPPAPAQQFHSRPDLRPPIVTLDTVASNAAPGLVFLAPKKNVAQAGPMIVDGRGRLVWFRPLDTHGVADFRVQVYDGRPVLTWWRGRAVKGVGDGYYVLVDGSYNQIATVHAGNGLTADIHEMLITERNTALITVYHPRPWNLSPLGGPREGSILEGIVQEIDIATGRVLFEWHSADHVAPSESYVEPPPAASDGKPAPYDYFHINSIELEPDGNLLVSARNTHAVYEIRPSDGAVLWRLGGKKSDFRMGPGTAFAWQHDARRQPGGTITLFDNAADDKDEDVHSRALELRVDTRQRRATLVRSYAHPRRLLATSQGDAQFLPGGHVFVGWGARPYFTEFDRDGTVLLDGHFGSGAGVDSYRAYRFEWTGRPGGKPALAVAPDGPGRVTVYASWNGATLVERWQVLAGSDPSHLRVVTTAARSGFETRIGVETDEPYVGVRALNEGGAILGTSNPVSTGAQPG